MPEPISTPVPFDPEAGRLELDALVARRQQLAAERLLAAQVARETVARLVIPEPTILRIPGTCIKCGAPFTKLVSEIWPGFTVGKLACDPCVARAEAQRASCAPNVGHSEDKWGATCPEVAFRSISEGGATDERRLAKDCPKLAEITGWQYGPKGLLLVGETGKCKTRALWRLLRKLHDHGKTIAVRSSGRFAREFADAAGTFVLSAWFDRLAAADVFVLDDLGKGRWTEGAWGQFFELIDERAKNHRPFFITTNETSDTLLAKIQDPATREPLKRRLLENMTRILL